MRPQVFDIVPGRMSGAACFTGTRVPAEQFVAILGGRGLGDFKATFPEISDEQLNAAIDFLNVAVQHECERIRELERAQENRHRRTTLVR